jgi:hypothetical protein
LHKVEYDKYECSSIKNSVSMIKKSVPAATPAAASTARAAGQAVGRAPVEAMPAVLEELAQKLVAEGILQPSQKPNTAVRTQRGSTRRRCKAQRQAGVVKRNACLVIPP